jgi:hypothetical protein
MDQQNTQTASPQNLGLQQPPPAQSIQNAQAPQRPVQNSSFGNCIACGTDLKMGIDHALFCPNCGYRPVQAGTEETNTKQEPKTWLTSENKALIIKVGFWILLAALAIYAAQMLIDALDFSL